MNQRKEGVVVLKVKNVYPKCYKDEAQRRKVLRQTYQKIVMKLVLENKKSGADRETS